MHIYTTHYDTVLSAYNTGPTIDVLHTMHYIDVYKPVLHTENVWLGGGQTESFQNVGGAKVYTMY